MSLVSSEREIVPWAARSFDHIRLLGVDAPGKGSIVDILLSNGQSAYVAETYPWPLTRLFGALLGRLKDDVVSIAKKQNRAKAWARLIARRLLEGGN